MRVVTRVVNCDYSQGLVCPRCGQKGRAGFERNCPSVPIDRNPAPCAHLAEETRRQLCKTCAGRVQIKVHACVLHGECTIGTKLLNIACCASCGDYRDQILN